MPDNELLSSITELMEKTIPELEVLANDTRLPGAMTGMASARLNKIEDFLEETALKAKQFLARAAKQSDETVVPPAGVANVRDVREIEVEVDVLNDDAAIWCDVFGCAHVETR